MSQMWTLKIFTINLNLHNKTNKCASIKYVLSRIINYQHVSTGFVITITITILQQY